MRVVFFDGVCGLCNHAVTWLLARDRQHVLRFAPLQGQTAAKVLPPRLRTDLDTMVFADDGHFYERSSGVLRAVVALGGVWRVAGIALMLPPQLLDVIYALVARYRYRWFGKSDACRLPTPAERAYFLD